MTRISRRQFISAATGSAAGLASVARSLARPDWSARNPAARAEFACALVDLEGCCALRESFVGYEGALARGRVRFLRAALEIATRAPLIIVPGCARLEPWLVTPLRSSLEQGSLVVIESGAAFAAPAEFEAHRSALDSHFGIEIDAPLDLWPDGVAEGFALPAPNLREGSALPDHAAKRPTRAGRPRVPYVDYTWPIEAKVRDFSRVVPLRLSGAGSKRDGVEPIGWTEGRLIAARRTIGRGTLAYLGSPLGPALRYRDREAERWLNTLLKLA